MARLRRQTRRAFGLAAVGGSCLLLGVFAGRTWADAAGERLWHDAPPPTGGGLPSFADVVERAQPGVVSVQAWVPRATAEAASEPAGAAPTLVEAAPTGLDEAVLRNGSGFVIDEQGYVVTSRHVVLDADLVEVLVPGQDRIRADVIGEDDAADLALLRLDTVPPDLHALAIGRSEDLRAGDWIVAVGNPYGFQQTVTAGIVSFVGRHLPHNDLQMTSDFVQISAPVNPGSSGGPVLALDGSVVGVTTKTAAEAQGISFAVPASTLKWVLEEIKDSPDGHVRRGFLGIEFTTYTGVDERGARCGGARVMRVLAGAPAAAAGLRQGDVVLAVDGERVADARALHQRIVRGAPGQQLAMRVLRQRTVHDSIDAVLGEMGTRPAMAWN